MKKTITLLLIGLLSMPLVAQNNHQERRNGISPFERVRKSDPDFHRKRIRQMFRPFGGEDIRRSTMMRKAAGKEQMDSLIGEEVNTSAYEISDRDYYKYDNAGHAIERLEFDWDEDNQEWRQEKENYQYDGNGRITEEITSVWDGVNSKWVNQWKYITTYNTHGRSEEIQQYWDQGTNKWVNQSKEVFAYTAAGKEESRTSYSWDLGSNQWQQSYKSENQYDANNNLIKREEFSWNVGTNQWETSGYRSEYTYSNGKLHTETYYYWNAGTNQWDFEYKGEYTYTSGKISELMEYEWDEVNLVWIEGYKGNYTYDANGNITQMLWSEWDGAQWMADDKLDINYDLNVPLADLYYHEDAFDDLFDDENGGSVNNKPLSMEYLEYDNGSWTGDYKETYYYSEFTGGTGILPLGNSEIKAYPNPTSDYIKFDLPETAGTSEVTIMDMNGKVVLQQNINTHNNQVKVSSLSKGVYLFKIAADDELNTGRFVVK